MCEKRNEKINLSQGKNIFVGACVRSSVRSFEIKTFSFSRELFVCSSVRAYVRSSESTFSFFILNYCQMVDRTAYFWYDSISIGWGFRNKRQKQLKLITFQSNSYLFSSNLFLYWIIVHFGDGFWPYTGQLTIFLFRMLIFCAYKIVTQ